jgi:molecular chaperone Hsp33
LGLQHPPLYDSQIPQLQEANHMTLTTRIAWDDTVLPFQLDRSDIRGRVARLDQTLDQVLSQHDYPTEVEAMVAEAALLTALIGQTMKLRWKLSLQVRGSGAIRLIATDFFAPGDDDTPARIRAYASYDAEKLVAGADPFAQIGKGYFAILIDQGSGTTPYQGITPLAGGSLSACAEAYFAQSEQLPTRFELSYGLSREPGQPASWRAGGVMLQHMPKASPLMADGASGEDGLLAATDLLDEEEGENWSRANILLDTAEALELIGPSVGPTDLLLRLFHEEGPRVFDALPVQFGCTCSAERVRTSLSIYSARDIGHMTTDDGRVTADCQFCGAHYEFDPRTLGFEAELPPGAEGGDDSAR